MFLVYMSRNIKAPIKKIYDDSIDNFLDAAVDNVKMWFENQVTVMNVFQRAVVDATDNPENIKRRIKTVPKPEGFEYCMVFWDTNTDAKDGGPETFNTKGGTSKAGILQKEYFVNHQKSDVAVWLESPRVAAAGGFTMPLFVKSDFVDAVTGEKITGGCVGFLELEPITHLGKYFYKTGKISIYDDKNEIRAGDDVLAEDSTDHLELYTKTFNLSNKVWTVVASVEKNSNIAKAGVEVGDVILKINSDKVTSVSKLRYYLYQYNIGDEVSITYYRNGKDYTVKVVLEGN
ncbi:MAG: PDZ domain-containing protein [Bacilli bacterium]|nr:PDZ domain-containing protein [Bacilli bacterium]